MIVIDDHVNQLLDAAPDAMVISDAQGKIVFANSLTEQLFGYERSELIGQQIEMLLPERLRAAHPAKRAAYAQCPRTRPMGDMVDLHACHRNGSEFAVDIRLSPLQTEKGLMICSAIREVTAHRHVAAQNILLIHNDPEQAHFMRETLASKRNGGRQVEWVRNCNDGVERLNRKDGAAIDAILTDLVLPDSYGIETFDRLFLSAPSTPILVLCYAYTEAIAQQAVRFGARNYLLKEHLSTHVLLHAVGDLLETSTEKDAAFAAKEVAQMTLNSIGEAVLTASRAGRVTYLNPMAESLTGWTRAEAATHSLDEVLRIIDGATRKPIRNPLFSAMEQNCKAGVTANCVLLRRDGAEVAIEDSAAPIHDSHGHVTGAVMVFRDVSKARAIALRMAYLAQHDTLTGLPNRLLLNDRLAQAIALARRHNQQLALLFVDLDCFKHINDSLGHLVGDQLLKSVADRLLACVRGADTVSRLGGDEFVVLLSEISHPTDAVLCAEKIINELGLPHTVEQHRLHLTASIGIAIYPDDGNEAETLVKNADSAMFRAKTNGRNNYYLHKPIGTSPAIPWQSSDKEMHCSLLHAEHDT